MPLIRMLDGEIKRVEVIRRNAKRADRRKTWKSNWRVERGDRPTRLARRSPQR